MKKIEYMSCEECGEALSIEEIDELNGVCPDCKKHVSWFSAPESFVNNSGDETEEEIEDE